MGTPSFSRTPDKSCHMHFSCILAKVFALPERQVFTRFRTHQHYTLLFGKRQNADRTLFVHRIYERMFKVPITEASSRHQRTKCTPNMVKRSIPPQIFPTGSIFLQTNEDGFSYARQERKNLSAALLTNVIYSSNILNNRIYQVREVSLSDG